MRKHFLQLKQMVLLCVVAAIAIGCSDSDDGKNLLTNPNGNNGEVKQILAPLKVGESMMPLALFDGQTKADTVPPPPEPDAVIHIKIPNYSKEVPVRHIEGTSYYEQIDNGDLWCHIPEGDWMSYYTTGPMLECPPGEIEFHIEDGEDATTIVKLWHIYEGDYYSYYYQPQPHDPDYPPPYDIIWCPVPADTIAVNAGRYIPMGGTHLASGSNASSYERTERGFDPMKLPEKLRNLR